MKNVITVQMRRMAWLFVNDAEVTGDWHAAARKAGYKRAPRLDLLPLRQLILDGGGKPPPVEWLDTRKPAVPDTLAEPPETDPLDLTHLDLPDPDDPDAEAKWKALAKKLLPTWRAIAQGEMDVSPTQRLVLKDILDRGFGRVGTKKPEEAQLGIVILPALRDAATMRVCPRCRATLPDAA